ncbi:molybdopterin molybdotransferase MoeA [Sphingomonas sp.]|uniref:molybdopterin molybdotransferase MoeA n=1 Tax=Sphingomonas sp. TaxID=28214 RepID=UPI00286BE011|nr:molybdopterin molybdotransferase MoeA [Sphingomonas sp.]
MTPLLPLDEARRILLDGHGALGSEIVSLADASGRTLAENVTARHDQPPAPTSAMDGYAVRAADSMQGARLRLVGEAPAGAPFAGLLGPGECVKIATGGIVPDGADRIVIQENVASAGGVVTIVDSSGPPFVRPAAMDFAYGQILVEAGQRLGPAAIGLIAAAGLAEVAVARRPRVAILAAGDELRDPGQPLAPGAIYNSATFALEALVEEWGAIAIRPVVLPDDLDRIVSAIRTLEDSADLIVPLGGASVGTRDLFRPAFEMVGAKMLFWGINVVPGKPCWHARLADGRPVLGLPGNPSSAFVCAHLLLRPLIDLCLGRDPAPSMALQIATLTDAIGENGAREAWLRAHVAIDAAGRALTTVDPRQDSGLQTPLLSANALVRRLPFSAPCAAGSTVQFLPFSRP